MGNITIPQIIYSKSESNYTTRYKPINEQVGWEARIKFFETIFKGQPIDIAEVAAHSNFVQLRNSDLLCVEISNNPDTPPTLAYLPKESPLYEIAKIALTGEALVKTPEPIKIPKPVTNSPPENNGAVSSAQPNSVSWIEKVNDQRHQEMLALQTRMETALRDLGNTFNQIDIRRNQDTAALQAQIGTLQQQQADHFRDWIRQQEQMAEQTRNLLTQTKRTASAPAPIKIPKPQIPAGNAARPRRFSLPHG